MKARSGSYDNDPWGSARNSRSGSKETLNTTGYGTPMYNNTVNGCKDPPCAYASASLSLVHSASASSFYSCAAMSLSLHTLFLLASVSAVTGVWGKGIEVVDAGQRGSWLLQARRFIEMERWRDNCTAVVGQ